jgi:hypothetical protein
MSADAAAAGAAGTMDGAAARARRLQALAAKFRDAMGSRELGRSGYRSMSRRL